MFSEQLPADAEFKDVQITGSSSDTYPGRLAYRRWSGAESFWRGFKLARKVVGILALCALPFAVMEPFLFMIWGSIFMAILFLFVGPFLHFKYWDERASFFFVEGQCPNCKVSGKLTPYLHTKLEDWVTVLCPACGETSKARST